MNSRGCWFFRVIGENPRSGCRGERAAGMTTLIRTLSALLVFAGGGLCLSPHRAPGTVPPPELFGEWQLTLKARDANGDGKLDADERDPARNVVFTEKQTKDYLRFNRDGTCAFYVHKVNGRFELRPESSGPPTLHLFDQNDNREGRGVLHTVNNTGLILFTGGVFSVFKRL